MYECDQIDPEYGACVGSAPNHYWCQFQEFDGPRLIKTHQKPNPNYVHVEKTSAGEFNEFAAGVARRMHEGEQELSDPGAVTQSVLRHGAHESEVDASYVVMPHTQPTRLAILDAIYEAGEAGRTDWENEVGIPIHRSTSSARRGELEKGGWVEWSGQRRPTPSGVRARVWVMTSEGRERYPRERHGAIRDYG